MLRILAFAILVSTCTAALAVNATAPSVKRPVDPGMRGGAPGAGGPLPGLASDEAQFFQDGLTRFQDIEVVTGGDNNGLGPRFNSNQCSSCHLQPAVGGTSPKPNPLIAVATLNGAKNTVPWFITNNGPIREAGFKRNPNGTPDGGVHDLFVITGRSDAAGCNIAQPKFRPAGDPLTGQGGNRNIIFRIPTPVFGAGLIEAIPDTTILKNMKADIYTKARLGISGHPNAIISGTANRSANDGTLTRFGWKAQNKSLLVFAGEAYNVEMGVTNQLFPQERDETPGCLFNATPEDTLNFGASPNTAVLSDIDAFANFMRLLAPPTPAPDTPSIASGRAIFSRTGCSACHTPRLTTGKIASGSSTIPSAALSNQTANLFSDLLLHHMGEGLADGITQGAAGPDEFRTAPLWGIGQRIFFLHDGRTTNLIAEFDAEGHYARLKGLIRDVTRRKRNEEHRQRLVAELDHRVKNILARVAVIAMSTSQRSNSMQEFVKALDGRIRSMADAHELLSQSRWQGANLADLVRLQLAPYTSNTGTTIAGPDITLTAETTQALAMVLQELATNALKYGALSNTNGRLSVNWNQQLSGDKAACLKIEWREIGGPPTVTPAQTGYGTSLIRELIPHELGGTVDLLFAPEGVNCNIQIPEQAR
jgi:CxxC motif-containing protein (DUF1111 family)